MLNVGEWVEGSFWPEPVEIKRCEPAGDAFYIVEALGRTSHKYYESLLEAYQLAGVRRMRDAEPKTFDGEALWQAMQGLALESDRRFSEARAQGNRRVIPLPHQIDAVYDRMLQAPLVRFLLADDPGAGKTIMAGMLLRELRVRGSADRILILVPPMVLTQWQDELQQKFGESFRIITRASVGANTSTNPFLEAPRCLTSLYWAARPEVKAWVTQAPWDLVIVDEAHKMAAYTRGQKLRKVERTQIYRLGETLLAEVPQCLLLTATPHKGDPENFRHLMQLVDPDVFAEVDPHEVMRERANPYIIRRLKESMVNFDGTPLFPPRTTKTLPFDLTPMELALYDAVTEYVRDHFNQAVQKKNGGAAFAMMLLQRRLSSSIEAITLSLVRRTERLQALWQKTTEEQQALQREWAALPADPDFSEAEEDEEAWEEQVAGAVLAVDAEALQEEIAVLQNLVGMAERVAHQGVERKYQELETTLFGEQGLLQQGEKMLIFTESRDTLRYLTRRLSARLGPGNVATIVGDYDREERARQVEHFRDSAPVMVATDAGGESINLQFCNQMINYDIPWNPNRLEQRMGRIHRIGQTHEVFIFNLVAINTREGDVMQHLLQKMEQMQTDLGADLVYNFMGDILEAQYGSMAELLQSCIVGRHNLSDIIADLDHTLSAEHQRLLAIAQEERLDSETVDLPALRQQQAVLMAEHLPPRWYGTFTQSVLKAHRVGFTEDAGRWQLSRLPKNLRDRMPEIGQQAFVWEDGPEGADVPVIDRDSPLYLTAAELARQAVSGALITLDIPYPTPDPLEVMGYHIAVGDGNGQILRDAVIHVARRADGSWLRLDPYWLFGARRGPVQPFTPEWEPGPFQQQALRDAVVVMSRMRQAREALVEKKVRYVSRSFDAQYSQRLGRLQHYQETNRENRNSALINQTTTQLAALEERRLSRISRLERERTIQMRPVKPLYAIRLLPSPQGARSLPNVWEASVREFAMTSGYQNFRAFPAFGLVDYYAENREGQPVYFLATTDPKVKWSAEHLRDMQALQGAVCVCIVGDGAVQGNSWLEDKVVRKGDLG